VQILEKYKNRDKVLAKFFRVLYLEKFWVEKGKDLMLNIRKSLVV